MKIKSVLFDLDGTLLDTAPDFLKVLNTILTEESRPPVSEQQVRATVSSGASALVQLGFAIDEQHKDFERLRQRLLELYSLHLADETQPYKGINETLEWLQQENMQWGIVTNKPAAYTEPLLRQIPLATSPDIVICPDHVSHRKPHPEPLLLAFKKLQCTPPQSVYLGDHRRDIDAGRNAGMDTIACAYGYIETNEIDAVLSR